MTRIDQLKGYIWLNGEFIKWEDTKIHLLTHWLHYASCVFEWERCYDGKVFKMTEHHERLLKSAEIMDMPMNYSVEDLNNAVLETLEKNNLENAYIRPIVWRWSESMWVYSEDCSVNVAIAVWDWPSYFDENLLNTWISLCWSEWVKPDPRSEPIAAKASGLYMTNTLAKNKSKKKWFDDAIMLDYRWFIAESTGSNIFFVIDWEIHTPEPHAFLNWITRQTVIEIAKEKGYKVHVRDIKPEELKNVSEVFVTWTAVEIVPVWKIENQIFQVWPITKDLRESYLKLVNS